jgi:hypothetical protein
MKIVPKAKQLLAVLFRGILASAQGRQCPVVRGKCHQWSVLKQLEKSIRHL